MVESRHKAPTSNTRRLPGMSARVGRLCSRLKTHLVLQVHLGWTEHVALLKQLDVLECLGAPVLDGRVCLHQLHASGALSRRRIPPCRFGHT